MLQQTQNINHKKNESKHNAELLNILFYRGKVQIYYRRGEKKSRSQSFQKTPRPLILRKTFSKFETDFVVRVSVGSSRLYDYSVSYVETKQNGCLPYTDIFCGGSPV